MQFQRGTVRNRGTDSGVEGTPCLGSCASSRRSPSKGVHKEGHELAKVTQYDVELFQRVEHFLGKKLEDAAFRVLCGGGCLGQHLWPVDSLLSFACLCLFVWERTKRTKGSYPLHLHSYGVLLLFHFRKRSLLQNPHGLRRSSPSWLTRR